MVHPTLFKPSVTAIHVFQKAQLCVALNEPKQRLKSVLNGGSARSAGFKH
jgi:hypothetical protein